MIDDNKEIFMKDLVREVARITGETQTSVENTVRVLFRQMGDHLVEGHKLYIIDFLNFETRYHAEKHVKHPQTGEPLTIAPYRTVAVHPTRSLKKRLKS